MYRPRYRYLFFVERPRSIWTQKELIGYLNSHNITPRCITKDQLSYDIIKDEIFSVTSSNDGKIHFSDYDIMFSETYGIWPYAKEILTASKKIGKTNLVIGNFPAINNFKPTFKRHYSPQNTTLINGICLIDKRTENCMNAINPELDTLVTGNPEWDIVNTPSFKEEVESVKQKYGEDLLLLCAGPFDHFKKQQEEYYKWVIDKAEEQNFNVIVSFHAESEEIPEYFRGHINTVSHRYVNLIAASHILTRVASGITQESMLFGKNVASIPFLFLGEKDKDTGLYHEWIEDDDRWKEKTLPRLGYDLFNVLPLVNNKSTLSAFLSSKKLLYSTRDVDNIFGMPKVASFREHFFKTVEKYMEEKK